MIDSCKDDKTLEELQLEQRNLITKRNEINLRLNKILKKEKSGHNGTHKWEENKGDENFLSKRKRSSSEIIEESEHSPFLTAALNDIIRKKKLISVFHIPTESEGPSCNKIQSILHDPNDSNVDTRPVIKLPIPKDPEVLKRSKNLFGKILTHLDKAKEKLEKDSTIIKLQEDIASKAVKIRKDEIEDMKIKEITLIETEKLKLIKTQDEIENRIQLIDKEINARYMKQYTRHLGNFILTSSTRPKLHWIPNKHNNETQRLLEESKKN